MSIAEVRGLELLTGDAIGSPEPRYVQRSQAWAHERRCPLSAAYRGWAPDPVALRGV